MLRGLALAWLVKESAQKAWGAYAEGMLRSRPPNETHLRALRGILGDMRLALERLEAVERYWLERSELTRLQAAKWRRRVGIAAGADRLAALGLVAAFERELESAILRELKTSELVHLARLDFDGHHEGYVALIQEAKHYGFDVSGLEYEDPPIDPDRVWVSSAEELEDTEEATWLEQLFSRRESFRVVLS